MVICAVFGCYSNNDKRLKRNMDETTREIVKYFHFPKDEHLKKIWIHKTGRSDKFNVKNSYICSKHFKSEDYLRNLKHELLNYSPPKSKKLKTNAVPSLNLGVAETSDSSETEERQTANDEAAERESVIVSGLQNEVDQIECAPSKSANNIQLMMSKSGALICSAQGCQMNRRLNPDVIMFDFPKKQETCELWIKIIGREDLLQKSLNFVHFNCKVCSEHFEDRMFSGKKKNRLRPTAIPTINVTKTLEECNEMNPTLSPQHVQFEEYKEMSVDEQCTTIKTEPTSDPLVLLAKEEICRGCLATINLMEIFSSDRDKLFAECTGILLYPSDGLPEKICHGCFNACIQWSEFKMICEHNNVVLRNQIDMIVQTKEASSIEGNFEDANDYAVIPKNEQLELGETRDESNNLDSNCVELLNDKIESKLSTSFKVVEVFQSEEVPIKSNRKFTPKRNMYNCENCATTFPSLKSLQLHSKTHDEPFQLCPLCGKTYKSQESLRQHLKNTHNSLNLVCEICKKEFKSYATLSFHKLSLHNTNRAFNCHICHKIFKRKDNLKNHIKLHETKSIRLQEASSTSTTSSKSEYKCPLCDVVTNKYRDFEYHCSITHSKQEGIDIAVLLNSGRKYECTVCSKRFVSKNGLEQHQRAHTNGIKVNRFVDCSFCGESFSNRNLLIQHENEDHGNTNFKPSLDKFENTDDQTEFKCNICHKTYDRLLKLKNHMRLHNNLKRHKCSVCSQRFSLTSYLRTHEMTHAKKTPCEKCGREFSFHVAFLKHQTSCTGVAASVLRRPKTHAKTLRRILNCPICDCEIRGLKLLEMHLIEMHHSGAIDVQEMLNNVKIFKCNYCDSRFSEEIFKARHERRVHTDNDIGISCTHCNRVFKSMLSLQYHFNIHHLEKKGGE